MVRASCYAITALAAFILIWLHSPLAFAGAKTIGPTKDYTRDQKIRRGIEVIESNISSLSSSNSKVLNLADISNIILIGSIRRNPSSPYNIFTDKLIYWYDEMNIRDSVSKTIPPSL